MIKRFKKFIAGKKDLFVGGFEKITYPLFVFFFALFVLAVVIFTRHPVELSVITSSKVYQLTGKEGRFKVDIFDRKEKYWENKYKELKKGNRKVLDDNDKIYRQNKSLQKQIEYLKSIYPHKVRGVMTGDLDGDGIKEVILVSNERVTFENSFTDRYTTFIVYEASANDGNLKEVYRKRIGWRVYKYSIEDLNSDGKNEVVIERYYGQKVYGESFILYYSKGRYDVRSSRLTGRYPFQLVNNAEQYGKFLIARNSFRGRLYENSEGFFIPSVYECNGVEIVKASESQRNRFYKKYFLPEIQRIKEGLKKDSIDQKTSVHCAGR